MALFPCAVGLHRYAGRQQSAYLGIANGALNARSKLRLCNSHFLDLREYCDEGLHLVAVGDSDQGFEDYGQGWCTRHPDARAEYRGFATLYPLGDEPRVYFAAMCQDDADAFRRIGQIELS